MACPSYQLILELTNGNTDDPGTDTLSFESSSILKKRQGMTHSDLVVSRKLFFLDKNADIARLPGILDTAYMNED
jgi:hypothetical protein